MAGGAIVATMPTATSHKRALWIDGLDVIASVAPESITVTEEGPGAVSSMTFKIDDIAATMSVPDSASILFQDLILDAPIFRGSVQVSTLEHMAGQQSRTITVECVGVEALLDWAILPADLLLLAGASQIRDHVQTIAANAIGLGDVRAFQPVAGGSSIAFPIENANRGLTDAVTIPAGTSVREAIRRVNALYNGTLSSTGRGLVATIDMYLGLRWYQDTPSSGPGYNNPNVTNDGTVGTINQQTTRIAHTTEPASLAGVYVQGTGFATLALTGRKTGPIAYLPDPSLTSAAAVAAAAAAYLSSYAVTVRGELVWDDLNPTGLWAGAGFRPGSVVNLTDAGLGVAGLLVTIQTITKTFNSANRENWVATYGGHAPSAAALIRQLTAAVRA